MFTSYLTLLYFAFLICLGIFLHIARWRRNLAEPFDATSATSATPSPTPAPMPPPPRFMDKHETYDFLREDKDGFVRSMMPDVAARRGITDLPAYAMQSARTAVSFHAREKARLAQIAAHVDTLLGDKASQKPWVFALTEGRTYEDGRPHVRRGVLFLSTDLLVQDLYDTCQMTRTLLHLRLQVCCAQRAHPDTVRYRHTTPWEVDKRHVPAEYQSMSCERLLDTSRPSVPATNPA